jgi:LacI family transcriptional regulator
MRPDDYPLEGMTQARKPPRDVRRVRMKDVAAASGVSRATVSLVVRDSPQIPDETKARVRAAIERLGYVYDHRAAVMRSPHTMTVGLIVTDIRNPYFAELTMALEVEFQEDGRALLMGYSQDDRQSEERLLGLMVEHHVDGVLILPSKDTTKADLERRLDMPGTPYVLVSREVPELDADYVGVDNIRAGTLLGEHFASEGFERVAFLGGPPQSSARAERQRGLGIGLSHHGIELDDTLSIPTNAERVGGIEAVQTLLRASPTPDAIACYSDVVAFGVMLGLRSAGLDPGLDVAIGSFDDIPEAELQHPPLTSVATYPERVGAEAARLLKERIEDPELATRRVLLSPRLSVRESTTSSRTSPRASSEEQS